MDDRPPGIDDVDSINNLDTARMTLRWALERLRRLEKTTQEVQKNSQDLESLRAAFQMRLQGDRQKELYYQRMEELFSSYCSGTLTSAQLEKRRLALSDMRRQLSSSQDRVEEETSLRRTDIAAGVGGALEGEFDKTREQLRSRRAEDLQRGELAAAKRRQDDFSARETELLKRQIELDSRERALNERQSCLDAEHQQRKARLEEDLNRARGQAAEESRLRLETFERDSCAQQEDLKKGWAVERETLLQKAKAWESLSRGYLHQVMGLQEQMLGTEIDAFARMDALQLKLKEKLAALRERRDLLDESRGLQEKDVENERSRVLTSIEEWRVEVEGILAERSKRITAEAARCQEEWRKRQADLAARETSLEEYRRQIDAKHKQIDELRQTLENTIQSYLRRTGQEAQGAAQGENNEKR